VRVSSIEEIRQALEALDGELRWDDVADRLIPLVERMRPAPAEAPQRIVVVVPPGVPISPGIDLGPAYVHVTATMVDGWSLSPGDVTARALANLHDLAAMIEPTQVIWTAIDDVEVGCLQTGRAIGSTLVLAPHELARILGSGPWLLAAPMRDLLLVLPPGEVQLSRSLFAEIATQDPNHLRPCLYLFDGRAIKVSVFGA
jgi:hypothetical protein